MYDIILIDPTVEEYREFKIKFPIAKKAEDFRHAQKIAMTDFFWVIWNDCKVLESFDFSYVPDDWSKQYVHVFLNNEHYDGICLVPKKASISDKEITHRFFINKKEVDIVASNPRYFDFFFVDNYNDYLTALENSKTEMFWVSSQNIYHNKDLITDFYISHHDAALRKQTHVFAHIVDESNYYNGLFLCSKHLPLSRKEVEYRFPVNRIEHTEIGSSKIKYDIFVIDSYQEYLFAFENSKTEMFWGTSNNISTTDFDFDTYFSHDNEYDRKTNHAFIHRVNNTDYYTGIFLCTKHTPITKREIEHRFIVNAKQWPIVASGPVQYEKFVIENYNDYLSALETSKTEMFWGTSNNIDFSSFSFDTYFSHDNEYDRKTNHAFIHRVNNTDYYTGIFLCTKHTPITKREIEHRFIVNAKQWPIVASGPIEYDRFNIDTYDEYLTALENTKTDMFWMLSRNMTVDLNVLSNIYVSHDSYDSKTNHAFIHSVDGQELYNGVFLCTKHIHLTKQEVEHRFIVNRKEWPIIASGPIEYDRFNIDTYEEYLSALENSKTEMFWIIPNYVTVDSNANFDLYFTHNQTFERTINHVFLNEKYYDGVILCSKYSKFSRQEFDYKFIANKVESPTIMSSPKPYDIVFISYKEPNADENYARLLSKRADAKRVHGVVGIHNAHIAAAKLVETDMLWIVDGDALIVDDFNFNYQVPRWNKDIVHVWRSKNPINDLVYGYGGVKLFPRILTIDMDTSKPDMTTSISKKFKAVENISNITLFNTDPFNTWKSAFRECTKLSSRIIDRQRDDETASRLLTWKTIGIDRKYGKYAIDGAIFGEQFGISCMGNLEKIKLINDFKWLEEKFNEQYN